jgi:hypothetical protein
MNIFFMFFLMMLSTSSLFSVMQKDPVTNKFYSVPASPEINQEIYNELLFHCFLISDGIIKYSNLTANQKHETIAQLSTLYLQAIGTPTSVRLISDLTKLNS